MATTETSSDRFITRPVAADRFGGTWKVVQRLIDLGELPGYRIGKRVLVRESDVDEYIERCRIEPAGVA